mmetsp:Transcript_81010/g.131264  ORF Transcript_81010/g.131264 Transcript_81010/m.131264 type:complete len:241 (+) Transcript_81010:1099-1821(+)
MAGVDGIIATGGAAGVSAADTLVSEGTGGFLPGGGAEGGMAGADGNIAAGGAAEACAADAFSFCGGITADQSISSSDASAARGGGAAGGGGASCSDGIVTFSKPFRSGCVTCSEDSSRMTTAEVPDFLVRSPSFALAVRLGSASCDFRPICSGLGRCGILGKSGRYLVPSGMLRITFSGRFLTPSGIFRINNLGTLSTYPLPSASTSMGIISLKASSGFFITALDSFSHSASLPLLSKSE